MSVLLVYVFAKTNSDSQRLSILTIVSVELYTLELLKALYVVLKEDYLENMSLKLENLFDLMIRFSMFQFLGFLYSSYLM